MKNKVKQIFIIAGSYEEFLDCIDINNFNKVICVYVVDAKQLESADANDVIIRFGQYWKNKAAKELGEHKPKLNITIK